MAAFHGYHTSFNYRNPHHSPNRTPMVAFHGCHSNPCNPQHPPNYLELSPADVDCLEAALTKLILSQLNLTAVFDTLATTIDNFLQRLSPRNPTPHFSSPVPVQAPTVIISTPLISTLRLMLTPSPMPPSSPMLTPLPMSPLSSMSIAPPCPAPVQPFLPPLSGLLPMHVLHLLNLGLIRTTISFNIVPLYGIAMAAYKLQSVAFALCSTVKSGVIRRNRPWDPDITFGSHALNPNTLRTRCFCKGREMIERQRCRKQLTVNLATRGATRRKNKKNHYQACMCDRG
ncbi:hypothetical protein HKD37_13G037850 [Glycine soja]